MKKWKREKPLPSQSRQIVYNVYLYFLLEVGMCTKKQKTDICTKSKSLVSQSTGMCKNNASKIMIMIDMINTDENVPPSSPKKHLFESGRSRL